MKKLISVILFLLISFSCAVTTPFWIDYRQEGVYVEYCRDTLTIDQLDSALISHKINPNTEEWSTIRYYNVEKDEMEQFMFTKGDTTYIVNKTKDNYIFTAKHLKN